MSRLPTVARAVLLLGLASLGGCVAYPADPYYGASYGPSPYYSAPAYVAPPTVYFGFGGGHDGGWRRRGWHHWR